MDDLTSACEYLSKVWGFTLHAHRNWISVTLRGEVDDHKYPDDKPNCLRTALIETAKSQGWKPPPSTTLAMGLYMREEMEEAFARGWYAAINAAEPMIRPDTGTPDFHIGPVDYTDLKEILCPEKKE